MAEQPFTEGDLTAEQQVSIPARSGTRLKITKFLVNRNGSEPFFFTEFEKLDVSGAEPIVLGKTNLRLANQPPDDEGNPQPQDWDLFITHVIPGTGGKTIGQLLDYIAHRAAKYVGLEAN